MEKLITPVGDLVASGEPEWPVVELRDDVDERRHLFLIYKGNQKGGGGDGGWGGFGWGFRSKESLRMRFWPCFALSVESVKNKKF